MLQKMASDLVDTELEIHTTMYVTQDTVLKEIDQLSVYQMVNGLQKYQHVKVSKMK